MKSIKELGGSLGVMASGTVINLILGISQGILTARLLGLEDYGRYASLLAFAAIIAKINDLGLPHAYSYFYRRSPAVLPGLLRLLLILVLWCCASAAAIVALISTVSLAFAPVASFSPWGLVAVGVLIATGTPLNILVSTVMATGNYKFFALLNSATAMLQTALIAASGLLGVVSLQLFVALAALSQLIVVCAVAGFFVRQVRGGASASLAAREVLSYGLRTQWGVLLKQLSARFELLFVASVLSPAHTGMFSLALSVRDAGLMPQAIYSAPLQNLIIDRNKPSGVSDDRGAILVSILLQLLLSAAMTLCAALALPFVIPLLYGQEYQQAVVPAIMLFASIIFIGAAGICWIAFNAKGQPHLTSLMLTVTGVPAPFVIYFLAASYGLYGASLASLLMAFLTFLFSFAGIVRLQRYSLKDLRYALGRTPLFLSNLLSVAIAQLRPKRLLSEDRG